MSKPRFTTQQMAAAGIIAAIYAALTLLLPIPQYGGIQFRVAEAMTVLPFLFPAATPGLFLWTGSWVRRPPCWLRSGHRSSITGRWRPCRR